MQWVLVCIVLVQKKGRNCSFIKILQFSKYNTYLQLYKFKIVEPLGNILILNIVTNACNVSDMPTVSNKVSFNFL